MLRKEDVDKIKTRNLCSITFFRKSCRYKVMWRHVVKPEWPQMIIRRMRIAC